MNAFRTLILSAANIGTKQQNVKQDHGILSSDKVVNKRWDNIDFSK